MRGRVVALAVAGGILAAPAPAHACSCIAPVQLLSPLPDAVDVPLDSAIVVALRADATIELLDETISVSVTFTSTAIDLDSGELQVLRPDALQMNHTYRVVITSSSGIEEHSFTVGTVATTAALPAVMLVDAEPQLLATGDGTCSNSCGDNNQQLQLAFAATPPAGAVAWMLDLRTGASDPAAHLLHHLPADGTLQSHDCYPSLVTLFDEGDSWCTRLRFVDGAGRIGETNEICTEALACAAKENDDCVWIRTGDTCRSPSGGGCSVTAHGRAGGWLALLALLALCYRRRR